MIVGKDELIGMVNNGMINSMIDSSIQIQPNGIELTVGRIERFIGKGSIDFSNIHRKLPKTEPIPWKKCQSGEWVTLSSGCYKVIFNEIVKIPKNMCAIAFPRSSLMRMGITVETAVWDAGYVGRSEALLIVYNPVGVDIQKGARFIQLIFMKLNSEQEGYSGIYQGEHINDLGTEHRI